MTRTGLYGTARPRLPTLVSGMTLVGTYFQNGFQSGKFSGKAMFTGPRKEEDPEALKLIVFQQIGLSP